MAMHNAFAFISNPRKTEVCAQKRSIIRETAGLITLQNGCLISTESHEIQASFDFAETIPHLFHIEHVINEDAREKQTRKPIKLSPTTPAAVELAPVFDAIDKLKESEDEEEPWTAGRVQVLAESSRE
jgi:hypothetical protein